MANCENVPNLQLSLSTVHTRYIPSQFIERGLREQDRQAYSFMLSAKQGSIWYQFNVAIGVTWSVIEPTPTRLPSERLDTTELSVQYYTVLSIVDAHKVVSGLPILHSEYEVPGEHIAFLRKFFRANDTQTLMKVLCYVLMTVFFTEKST